MEDYGRPVVLAHRRAYAESVLANAQARQASRPDQENKGHFGFPVGEVMKFVQTEDEIAMCSEPEGTGALTGWPYSVPLNDGPFGYQVGGDHYAKYPIQPTEYIIKNKLCF